ncbi:NifB/NifX family molybdenum-iron cluster-binding protein [Salidesulfovibrio onnuriiensis]|uniref:NifB/NifX family molybdenum-iron cluster-binding protein n=1 Tax=Salidesulfovibrio onnuriiensis TaxID=2583823 RepID=UPI0011CB25DD|nr:NifB/NifX family molybdenum-iron cluster-binding protein [Salidesulfovibrio onnuriiensis]
MKIAIPSTRPDLSGTVEDKLGTTEYLLLVETDDMSFEAVQGPQQSSGHGAGVAVISLAVSLGARVILVGYTAPHIVNAMKRQSVEVVTGISGPVKKALATYLKPGKETEDKTPQPSVETRSAWGEALRKGGRQFYSLAPRLVGVVLLLGLFRGFVSEKTLLALFPGSTALDSIWGATLGSILAGNPVNSYVIGKGLLNSGVAMAGITALMLAWVNVGVIQLPVEMSAMGRRFALVRNLSAFVMAILLSLAIVLWDGGLA